MKIATLSTIVLILTSCGGGTPATAPPIPSAPAPAAGQTLTFRKDGAPVAVDFDRWGTPAYYQRSTGVSRLVVAANEVLGDAGRFVSLDLIARGDAPVTTGTYDCSTSDAPVAGEVVYAEESMTRVWKSAPGLPCTVTVTGIGAVGGHLEGTFSATLAAKRGATGPVVISDGVSAVERGPYAE